VRGEFDALRKVARLVSDYLAGFSSADGVVDTAKLQELRAALDDLECRYPYTLEPRSLAGELHALINERFNQTESQSTSAAPFDQPGLDNSTERF